MWPKSYRGRYCKGEICWIQPVVSNKNSRKEIRVEQKILSQVNKADVGKARVQKEGLLWWKRNEDRVDHIEFQGHNADIDQLARKVGQNLKPQSRVDFCVGNCHC